MIVRYLKIRKKELMGDIESLLDRAGLVDSHTKMARPDKIFISKEDARILRRNVGPTTYLNIGPSTLLEEVIRPGYALVLEPESYDDDPGFR